jgi:hypothetical protein
MASSLPSNSEFTCIALPLDEVEVVAIAHAPWS